MIERGSVSSNRADIYVSAPARVCLFGDNVDWISGPAMLMAIDNLRTYARIERTAQKGLVFASNNVKKGDGESIFVDPDKFSQYQGNWSDYMHASLKVVKDRYGFDFTNLRLEVNSTLPIGAGLSSSAALCIATIGLVDRYFELGMSPGEIAALAFKAEHYELNIPCGQMDQYSITHGGTLYVNCKDEPPKEIEKFSPDRDLVIVVGDTQEPKSTSQVINAIKARIAQKDELVNKYIDVSEKIIFSARLHLKNSSWNRKLVGDWMNECQESMRDHLKTSTPKLNDFCNTAMNAGAFGAKISGSGMGGCMFALCDKESYKSVSEALVLKGGVVFSGKIAEEGLKAESEQGFM